MSSKPLAIAILKEFAVIRRLSILGAVLFATIGVATMATAQDYASEAESQLSGIYGMYRMADFCLTQGQGATTNSLDNIKAAAAKFEAELNDEAREKELWEASAEEAAMILAMMSADGELARDNCDRMNVIVGALSMSSAGDKPF